MMLGSWCRQVRSFQISSDLLLNDWSFDRSGRHPLSVGHVPHGGMICCPQDHAISLIAIYTIVLFHRLQSTWSWYFIDRNIPDRFNLVSQGFEPRTKQYNFLLVLGLIPRPDWLFQASVIHGLCHLDQRLLVWWFPFGGFWIDNFWFDVIWISLW